MSKQKNKHKQTQPAKPLNFVAKHMNEFNHSSVEVDRKKKSKRLTNRKLKHKGRPYEY